MMRLFVTLATLLGSVLAANAQCASGYTQLDSTKNFVCQGSTAPTGSLIGWQKTMGSATVNLTTLGSMDWVAWGYLAPTNVDKKSTGGSQFSVLTVDAGAANSYSDNPVTATWTNGTPHASVTAEAWGVHNPYGLNDGFSFTVPASLTSHTLVLETRRFNTNGKLTAHLSDSSAPDFVDSTTSTSGGINTEYTIIYNAAAAGQTLTITWKNLTSGGNVALSAAVLQ